MSDVIVVLSSLLSGVIGGGLGFFLSNRRLNKNNKRYLCLLWRELEDIAHDEKVLIERLFDELDSPIRTGYSLGNDIDWDYLKHINVSLASDAPFNIHRLIMRMKVQHDSATNNLDARIRERSDTEYYCNPEVVLASIVSLCGFIWLVHKALEQKSRFKISGHVPSTDVINAVFDKYDLPDKYRKRVVQFAATHSVPIDQS